MINRRSRQSADPGHQTDPATSQRPRFQSDKAPSALFLIENGLMGLDDVVELFGSGDESQFPEPKRIAYDQQFSFGICFFQSLQKLDELGGVITVLQLAVTTHMQVADEVVSLCHLHAEKLIAPVGAGRLSDLALAKFSFVQCKGSRMLGLPPRSLLSKRRLRLIA